MYPSKSKAPSPNFISTSSKLIHLHLLSKFKKIFLIKKIIYMKYEKYKIIRTIVHSSFLNVSLSFFYFFFENILLYIDFFILIFL